MIIAHVITFITTIIVVVGIILGSHHQIVEHRKNSKKVSKRFGYKKI